MRFEFEVILVKAIEDDETENLIKGDFYLCIFDVHREVFIDLEDPECQYSDHTIEIIERFKVVKEVR